MNQITNGFSSIQQVTDTYLNKGSSYKTSGTDSFASFLDQQIRLQDKGAEEIRFSKHAAKRLDDREISMTEEQKERLFDGVSRASEKGINDSLVMVDSLAFIVNIPSHTVITALENGQSDEGVFTNIDGAVIA